MSFVPIDATVPEAVRALARDRPVRAVWANELGGTTFEVGAGDERCFAKWTPVGSGVDLSREAERLTWAVAYTPVPRVLDVGADDAGSWMVTAALPGESAVAARW